MHMSATHIGVNLDKKWRGPDHGEHEPIRRVWRRTAEPPVGAEPLVRGSGRIGHPKEGANWQTEDSFIIGVACGKKWGGGSEA